MYRRIKRILFLAIFLTTCFSALAQVTSPDFSVVVLPDAQNYTEYHPEIFTAQTQWIVNNRAKYNIQFVLGEGDMVNLADQTVQWQNADAAIRLLDNANIPYVLPIGNHDYDDYHPSSRGTTAFNTYFGPSRYAQYSWYKGGYPGGTNDNFYADFTVNGKQYLILALEFVPRDASLDWAKTVLDSNPDKEIIVATHSFTFMDSTRADQCNNNDMPPSGNNQGEDVWQKLLINYPNFSLVVSGHFVGNPARRADLGIHKNVVNELFTDYQDLPNAGDGWMRIMTFRPLLNRIDVVTYSPYLNQYMTDSINKFSLTWHSTGVADSTGTIAGTVQGERTAPSPYTCVPILGAAVTAGGTSATSDSNGSFSLGLPSGNYTVSATAPGWAATGDEEEGAYPGYTSSAKLFLEPLVGNVAGKVTDSWGNPVSGAAIAFSGGTIPTQVSVTANATGSYTAPSISAGSYNVTASATGLTTTTATTKVTRDASTTLNLKLSGWAGGTCPGSGVNRTVVICSPANNATISSPVTIVAQGTDSASILVTQIYIDGVKQFQVDGSSVNTSLPLAAGAHRITVVAVDSAGTFKSSVNVTVSSSTGGTCAGSGVNRTVTICSPANNATVTSPVSIVAQGTDSAAILVTQIYIDGAKQFQVDGSSVNTSLPLAAGAHRITVVAVDSAGTFKSSVNLTVSSSTGGTCAGSGVNRTVTICSPANNATVTSPVSIVAQGTDSAAILVTQIYIDGAKQFQVDGSSVNTSLPLAAGAHRITVVAVDSAGTFKSSVNLTVSSSTGGTCAGSGVNRTVTICSPENNATVTSPVSIVAQATDSAAITNMQILIDGVNQYQIAGSSVNTSLPLTSGTHRITVVAVDSAGTFQSIVNVTVSSTGGTCAGSGVNRTIVICSPANNATVTSPVSIVAQATDSAAIANMQIYIDGVKQYQGAAGSSVNTSLPLTSGTHRIVVLAVDGAGTFQSAVYVTVSSTSGACSAPPSAGVNICQPASGATVSSPVAIQATSNITGTFSRMEVWIDGVKKYTETTSTALNTTLTLGAGTHRFAILAFNTAGTKWQQAVNATVK